MLSKNNPRDSFFFFIEIFWEIIEAKCSYVDYVHEYSVLRFRKWNSRIFHTPIDQF